MKNDVHATTDWSLQAKRANRNHWYVIYKTVNLKTGEVYIGRHTINAGKKPFEENSYLGSGSAVKRWKKRGDPLLKGVVMYSTKSDLYKDEVAVVDYMRGEHGKLLKNKESWERQMYGHKPEGSWQWRGI